MPNFVEFTAANGGFPVLVNPNSVISLEPAGHGTALSLVNRETLRVAEPLDVALARLSDAVVTVTAADPEAVPAAAKREKK